MATGVVITVAEKLFTVITSQEFKEVCSMFGYESQLDELAVTVSTIKAVLLDADLKHQELTHGGREFIERLKDAVYDVDDVLDEFNTMVLKEKKKAGGKTLKKQRKETGSYAREDSIIGREADKAAIVGVLIGESDSQPDIQDNVTFVTIVGMGGLGKTALAQLVYNDEKIKDVFNVRLWVCVSNEFSMEQIFAKMIGKDATIGMNELQSEVRNMIEGRKYLLVLDDVWDENHNKWVELTDFLMLGEKGSRVLITSRSKAVARAINNNHTYELQGLSDENSWHLFKKMAFETGKSSLDHELVDIGKDVVKKCANVPLSIRVVGSLLYGQHKRKWLSFKSIDLRNLGTSEDGQAEDGIMPILKYSYYHLSPSLKSCFSYCALFPKNFKIKKWALIWLWMAHGCLDQLNDEQSMEVVGDEYFSILLHRCFFQDIEKNAYGDILYCKMHDLLHDLAQVVAGRESLALDTGRFQFNKEIRHLSMANDGCELLTGPENRLGELKKLRSLLHNYDPRIIEIATVSNMNTVCSSLRRLRVLDLASFELRTLPNTLGGLSHLRYLDLSSNRSLEILPESISQLHNLQVLNLTNTGVRELPKRLRNLHNLRHLILAFCNGLNHMPVGMDSMTGLQTLSMFVVASKTCKHGKTGRLEDLRSLVHLNGTLEIVFERGFCHELTHTMEGAYLLSNKVHLQDIVIRWELDPGNECSTGFVHEILLERLRPHCNIQGIEIWGYEGVKISSWVESLATFFPCLIKVSLHGFSWLCNLPSFGKLLHLKVLQLSSMLMVEFIESDDNTALSNADRFPLFPSLEELVLSSLPKLKGVWSDDYLSTEAHRKLATCHSFPRLHKLEIDGCPNLKMVPRCPGLKTLQLLDVHEEFRFISNPTSVDPGSSNFDPSDIYLENVRLNKVGLLNILFGQSLKGIVSLFIKDVQPEIMLATADLFQKHASSFRSLTFFNCHGVESFRGGGIEHLTSLVYLAIHMSDELDLGEGEEFKSLKNLGTLALWSLSKLIYLPEGFRHLTSLQILRICDCKLESLPEWLSCLPLTFLCLELCTELKSLPQAISQMSSLSKLRIWGCRNLNDRLSEPYGEDWPKISHIPNLDIHTDF